MGITDFIKDNLLEKQDEQAQANLKRVIDGKTYWHYSLLKNWPKNEELRLIKYGGPLCQDTKTD